ncbi:MFS general substrate transporter [Phanerochaete sordida]|uniref:MFS general substrate transporter n=1 Tax=Phanerochaete sordida TaxID=48140 RepID=A0A9P3GIW1_9APHY|nr:MFS general substrate transporter [Phanerochaete sordida]
MDRDAEKEARSSADASASALTPTTSSGAPSDPYEVTLELADDPAYAYPLWRRWLACIIVNAGAVCVTGASAMAATAEIGVAQTFHVSTEVSTLAVTLFVVGLGTGPILTGPVAEVVGQQALYLTSFFLMFCFTWPVAFSHSIAVHMVFRFLQGFCGSAFLSIGGATVNSLFTNETVAVPMAAYTIATFVGPVLTPVFSGFIYEYAGWRWLYYVLIAWTFGELVALLAVPETVVSVILRRKAQKLRKATGDERYYAAVERQSSSILQALGQACKDIFALMLFDRMALLLDIWLSLILGIVYLTLQAFPIIFGGKHGFTPAQVGLSFLGVFVGLGVALASMAYWKRFRARVAAAHGGNPPPEVWLAMGKVGGVLIPISLYCLAFTTYRSVHWSGPIIAALPFGTGICFVYISVFTYFVTAYRPMAAAALSGCAVMRTSFAAAFPLFANQMYARMGTVGATAFLAGVMTLMAPLPFVFAKIGGRLRERSPYATHCAREEQNTQEKHAQEKQAHA